MIYSKATYKLGNFVHFNNQLHLIFNQTDSIIGHVLHLVSCDDQLQIHLVHEKNVEPYTRKPNGKTPASNMTTKQKSCIERIEKVLEIEFNGRTLSDVSLFIGQFLPASQHKRYSDEELDDMRYEGLDHTDFM